MLDQLSAVLPGLPSKEIADMKTKFAIITLVIILVIVAMFLQAFAVQATDQNIKCHWPTPTPTRTEPTKSPCLTNMHVPEMPCHTLSPIDPGYYPPIP